MKIDSEALVGGTFGSLVSLSGMTMQEANYIVNIICAVVGMLITIITAVIIPVVKWYRKAKEDGKITADEIQEGAETLANGLEEVEDKLNETKGKSTDSK